tara:strand:+ start:2783 stop:3505 length:723 start_codon:yes stop_codon:yes gene_type:complete
MKKASSILFNERNKLLGNQYRETEELTEDSTLLLTQGLTSDTTLNYINMNTENSYLNRKAAPLKKYKGFADKFKENEVYNMEALNSVGFDYNLELNQLSKARGYISDEHGKVINKFVQENDIALSEQSFSILCDKKFFKSGSENKLIDRFILCFSEDRYHDLNNKSILIQVTESKLDFNKNKVWIPILERCYVFLIAFLFLSVPLAIFNCQITSFSMFIFIFVLAMFTFNGHKQSFNLKN